MALDWTLLVPIFDAIAVSLVLISVHFYVESFLQMKKQNGNSNAKTTS